MNQVRVQPVTSEQVQSMSVAQLKLQLKARSLSASGRKAVLQERLLKHNHTDSTAAQSKQRHYCGCLNTEHGLVPWLRTANMKLLIEAGTRRDPEWYRSKLKQMFVCLTTNTHDGSCDLPCPIPF